MDRSVQPHRLVPPTSDSSELDRVELFAVAEGLALSARWWPGMDRPTRRIWKLMVASESFEAWVIAWPPGGAITLHDHGHSVGAVVVASGELEETAVAEGADGGLGIATTVLPPGAAITFGATHIHDVVNQGIVPAISVHVYSPRLTAMTYYEITDGRLEPGQTIRYRLGEAIL